MVPVSGGIGETDPFGMAPVVKVGQNRLCRRTTGYSPPETGSRTTQDGPSVHPSLGLSVSRLRGRRHRGRRTHPRLPVDRKGYTGISTVCLGPGESSPVRVLVHFPSTGDRARGKDRVSFWGTPRHLPPRPLSRNRDPLPGPRPST